MNTRANAMQERPFQHLGHSVPDIFNSGSRPVSGKTTSVNPNSRPTTPSTKTQLRFIRPQSTRGGNPKMNISNTSRQTHLPKQKTNLNNSFIEYTSQIDSI